MNDNSLYLEEYLPNFLYLAADTNPLGICLSKILKSFLLDFKFLDDVNFDV